MRDIVRPSGRTARATSLAIPFSIAQLYANLASSTTFFCMKVHTSCNTQKDCCKPKTTCVTQPQEIHSDDWYSQQTLARYLKKLPKSEFDKFVGLYFVSDEDLQKLDSLTTK